MTNFAARALGACTGFALAFAPVAAAAKSASTLNDLVGAKAAGAESDLQSRGFRTVDGFQSGSNGKGTIWCNSRTQQCLQMITINGRSDSIEDIQTHQNCR